MDMENLRAMLREKAKTTPGIGYKPTRRQIVEALADEIKGMLKAGYRLADVAAFLRENGGVDLNPNTISTYMSRCRARKAKKSRERAPGRAESARKAALRKTAEDCLRAASGERKTLEIELSKEGL